SRQVTVIQAAAILISSIIGVGVLAVPVFAVRTAESGAPLITLLGMIIAMIGLILLTTLGQRFPSQTIVQYSELIIGKWPARFMSVLVIIFFAILTSLAAREFGEVVITAVLTQT